MFKNQKDRRIKSKSIWNKERNKFLIKFHAMNYICLQIAYSRYVEITGEYSIAYFRAYVLRQHDYRCG